MPGHEQGHEGDDERLATVERRLDVVISRYTPYLGLGVGVALTPVVIKDGSPPFWLLVGVLSLLTVGWCVVYSGGRPARAERAPHGAIYIGGLLVLMAVLTYASPLFAFLGIAVFTHAFLFLKGRWRFAAVGVAAVMVAFAQVGGRFVALTPLVVLGIAVLAVLNALLTGTFTYYGVYLSAQSARRGTMIDELNAANAQLSEALRENADLHALLVSQARTAGVHDERARMAREIHDTIAQGLTGIVTQLEAARSTADPATADRYVDTARALARESLTEARRSVAALAPADLVDAQLPDAICDMATRWAATTGVRVSVDTTGDPRPMVPEIEVALFRVAQEALANVGKHAAAGRVGLTLSYMGDLVVLDVRDDGCGFNRAELAGPASGSGFGLAAMEQRVRRVSGTLTVESAPGEGTAISAGVPAILAVADTREERG